MEDEKPKKPISASGDLKNEIFSWYKSDDDED